MKHSLSILVRGMVPCFLLILTTAFAQPSHRERIDSATIDLIKDEALNRSEVMDILGTLTDVYGPRLAWSPEYRAAAEWAAKQLRSYGVENVHFDGFGPVGKGWTLKHFSAHVTHPKTFPLIAFPKAWSPETGRISGEVVFLDVPTLADFAAYKGKLKGKFILLNDPVTVSPHFQPMAARDADSTLLRLANADMPESGPRRGGRGGRLATMSFDSAVASVLRADPTMDSARAVRIVNALHVTPRKLLFAQQEGAIAVLTAGRGDGGTVFVQQATVPQPPDISPSDRKQPYDPKSGKFVPQIAVAAEHYNRMVRLLQKGEKVRMEMMYETTSSKNDSGINIIGEIPGTDLREQVVMIGGHFDSWHAGTGATDNATGVAVSMEAIRILKKLGLQPRRTIRIGLWGAEEVGLIGSRAHVLKHFARRPMGGGRLETTPAYDQFSVYFNHDNGTGRLRGVHLQGNEAARPVFRSWLSAFNDPTAQTLTLRNTGGTDHLAFDGVGLPGFQFIQDDIEYGTRTHHSNMDVYDRVLEEDVKQAAAIMAVFAYQAAMRDELFPRKPMEVPDARVRTSR